MGDKMYRKNIICPYCHRFFRKNTDLKKHHSAKHPEKKFYFFGIYDESSLPYDLREKERIDD